MVRRQPHHAREQRTMPHPVPTQRPVEDCARCLAQKSRQPAVELCWIDKLVAVDKVRRMGVVPTRRVPTCASVTVSDVYSAAEGPTTTSGVFNGILKLGS
jgi:hypothetical protein